ncbi:hypothetical protein DL766_005194 [Monosporascus sp. MC13-8B]|uniref:J domain-containing protein n=1 Tax=Monosporascus cannonballus TaxID=155416 RepID=A0ABY0HA71_9PEZI|nr:hypothetical protein DL762_003572 [Monosporascus cannonballus]RYO98177.1 hypothetical protein DL763_002418 [Monosporascus cannonballus]RYP29829.1 hypothetical protein DL766_005194 [Monosporascus sp. MC13-8B]
MVADTTLYEILDVQPAATTREIKEAYRKKALKWHPDKNPDPAAEGMFKDVVRANEILSDKAKRRNYDEFGLGSFSARGGGRYGATGTSPYSSSTRGTSSGLNDEDFEAFFRAARSRRRTRTRGGYGSAYAADEFPGIPSFADLRPKPGLCLMVVYVLLDMAFSTAAGAAAAAAGAHADGGAPTPRATQIGALAGLTKSAITGFVCLWATGTLAPLLLRALSLLVLMLPACWTTFAHSSRRPWRCYVGRSCTESGPEHLHTSCRSGGRSGLRNHQQSPSRFFGFTRVLLFMQPSDADGG